MQRCAVLTRPTRTPDPTDERVQKLARRWMELVEEFTGGDPGIRRSLGNVWQQEESVAGMNTDHMRGLMDQTYP